MKPENRKRKKTQRFIEENDEIPPKNGNKENPPKNRKKCSKNLAEETPPKPNLPPKKPKIVKKRGKPSEKNSKTSNNEGIPAGPSTDFDPLQPSTSGQRLVECTSSDQSENSETTRPTGAGVESESELSPDDDNFEFTFADFADIEHQFHLENQG